MLPVDSHVFIVIDRSERMDLSHPPYTTRYREAFRALCDLANGSRFVPWKWRSNQAPATSAVNLP